MSERVFIDTNIFVYADDLAAKVKRPRARALLSPLIRERRAVISTQVIQEYLVVASKKLGLSTEHARARVQALGRLEVIIVRPELILGAIELHRDHSLSFWDALIVKAAVAAGCARLLTEDLNDGQVIEGLTITHPF
ncbi:MAG: PIN domain-containing protein [Kofleriaceae bacterium]